MFIAKVLIEYSTDVLNEPFDYLAPYKLDKGVRVKVVFNNKEIVGYVIDCYESSESLAEYEKLHGFTLSKIIDVIDEKPLLNEELDELALFLAKEYFTPLISAYQTILPPKLKPSRTQISGIRKFNAFRLLGDYNDEGLSNNEKELYDIIHQQKEIFSKDYKGYTTIFNRLVKKKKIELFKKSFSNELNNIDTPKIEGPVLTSEQLNVINEIKDSKDSVFLLEGVTGSGKTEVYINLTKYYLSINKTVIILVPEISLTPLIIKRFKERFDCEIAILHSGLSDVERYNEYVKIKNKEVSIVIGARSAVFAPLENIGLIILDEEHSDSYKQDNQPSYHAKDIAIFRASKWCGKVLLGSATPSLETKARAVKGVYHQLYLKNRVNRHVLPNIKIVDMTNEYKQGNLSFVSSTLKTSILERLERKEQVMLLLNRRGYSYFLECRSCHYVFKCPSCDISLKYHKDSHSLKCHFCGHNEKYPLSCPVCKKNKFTYFGMGTQKIEEKLNEMFPSAKIARMDTDSINDTKKLTNLLNKFANKDIDILLGTQMIAKGHDFDNVTLVGVINADIGLYSSDFRAQERTFQLLTQVAGRSGRGSKQGEAIIQTSSIDNYAIKLASSHDFEYFFIEEMKYRSVRKYPPYRYLLTLYFLSSKQDMAYSFSLKMKELIESKNLPDVSVLGPVQPYIKKISNKYRIKLTLKYKDKNLIYPIIEEIRSIVRLNNKLNLSIIVDPLNNEE